MRQVLDALMRRAWRFEPSAQMVQLVAFGAIGAISTAIYAALAFLLILPGSIPAWTASGLAYVVTSVFSYFCHKRLTFRSAASHRQEAPRFIMSNLLGYAIALALPMLLSDHLHAPPAIAILLTIVTVPILNFLLLNRFVFRSRNRQQIRTA